MLLVIRKQEEEYFQEEEKETAERLFRKTKNEYGRILKRPSFLKRRE